MGRKGARIGMGEAVIEFRGEIVPASFAEFAAHRALRLSLGLATLALGSGRAAFRVTGPAELIDAFEMALSLGPRDCLVRDVIRPAPATEGSTG
jgi:hypothetical protein